MIFCSTPFPVYDDNIPATPTITTTVTDIEPFK